MSSHKKEGQGGLKAQPEQGLRGVNELCGGARIFGVAEAE